ncbi:UNVERIFIED_CONTAM: hypothetical protein Sradi_1628400 [Sesamum radiatum]|uniref:Uncharacterized protein n=1 Tax=Sesamum radiatum TaxID=300843 RepID=A0AAW2UBB8_SESRA
MPTVLQFGAQHRNLTFHGGDLLLQIHHRLPQLGVFILRDRDSPLGDAARLGLSGSWPDILAAELWVPAPRLGP